MPPCERMPSLSNTFFATGRLAPKPFVLGALAVYFAGFLSQFLLGSPVTARLHVIPFVLAQIVMGWGWYVLHARRLRDAGRGVGPAVALTILYALAIVLLLLVMAVANNMALPDTQGLASTSIVAVFLMLFLASLVIGADAAMGMFGYAFLGALVLITLPVLIAFVFTIWLANRPSVPASPP